MIEFLKNKRGAMEMTMGTIVTIVLLVAILVVVLFFVNKIRSSGSDAIDNIDQAVQDEIDSLFADPNKKVSIAPKSRRISLDKGDSGGIGFSINNVEQTEGLFTYEVSTQEIAAGCQMNKDQAERLIILGKTGSGVNIPSGDKLPDAILVKFSIPESASLCDIRYGIDIKKDGTTYVPTVTFDLEITA